VAVCGIASISKDHEDILGSRLAAIAAEKAGIIKEYIPVVVMPQEDGVMRVVTGRARELSAPVFGGGKDIHAQFRKPVQRDRPGLGQRLDLETRRNVYPDIPIAMLGRHQLENAALALGLTDLFLEYMDREPLDSLVLKRAWRSLALPARLEVTSDHPWHIVDGAHNPASAWAAAEMVEEAFSTDNRTLLFGVAKDKDYRTMLRVLAPLFRRIVLTAFDSPRAAPASELDQFLKREFPRIAVSVAPDPSRALELAESQTPADGLILTTGSLWLAGEMRALCRREKMAQS
jgi:dihydrofolate synthase/folylpolyglutamate synthase